MILVASWYQLCLDSKFRQGHDLLTILSISGVSLLCLDSKFRQGHDGFKEAGLPLLSYSFALIPNSGRGMIRGGVSGVMLACFALIPNSGRGMTKAPKTKMHWDDGFAFDSKFRRGMMAMGCASAHAGAELCLDSKFRQGHDLKDRVQQCASTSWPALP